MSHILLCMRVKCQIFLACYGHCRGVAKGFQKHSICMDSDFSPSFWGWGFGRVGGFVILVGNEIPIQSSNFKNI